MSDLAWTCVWLAVVGGAAATAIALRALGVSSTYVRDLLHIGGGVWVASWLGWHGIVAPMTITLAATAAVAAVPLVAARTTIAARLHRSVTGGDERWTGLTHYALAFTALTAIALAGHRFTAACGLFALALGDGIGGAVGRAAGHAHYQARWGKRKSLEGSLTVTLAAALGVALAARLFDRDVPASIALAIGAVAALVEALAPRGTDNLLVPAAAWATAELLT